MASGPQRTILHVLDDLGTGGAERQLIAFLVRSDKSRFRHEVCALSSGEWSVAELDRLGIPVHLMNLRSSRDFVRSTLRLRQLVRKVHPDILHSTLYRPSIVSRVVGRLSRKPVVTSLVSTTYEPEWFVDNPHLKAWKVWLARTLDAASARWWGTRFVAITESVKASAIRQLGLLPGSICVIPRGVTLNGSVEPGESDVASIRAAYGWADTYPLILNVGRLVPPKGQRYAILAMKDVLLKFPRARLVIAGEGWSRATLERLTREAGLTDHVTFLGERQDVTTLLHAADLFVFPSISEGLGNALLEAMAAGKPCVASGIPALREVTGEGTVALLAVPRSPESLAAQLMRVAGDRVFARDLGEAARAWVRSHYNIRDSVAALESLYEDLLSGEAARVDHTRAGGMARLGRAAPRIRMRSWSRAAIERVADVVIRGSGVLTLVRRVDAREAQVLRVLAYHRVVDPLRDPIRGDPGVISATPETFATQIRLLARHYAPIGVSELEAGMRGGRPLPRRAVLVTFDDAYRDFLVNAWPVLREYRVPAILFVPSAYPDRARSFWWDELWQMFSRSTAPEASLPGLGRVDLRTVRGRWATMVRLRREMRALSPAGVHQRMAELRLSLGVAVGSTSAVLGWEELRTLAREGVTIASHGRRHASMPSLTESEIVEEIDGAQADMQRELGAVARIFAYPFGHYDPRGASVLKSRGFLAAFGTVPGQNKMPLADPFKILRQSVNAEHSLSRVQLGLSGFYPKPLVRLSAILRPRMF